MNRRNYSRHFLLAAICLWAFALLALAHGMERATRRLQISHGRSFHRTRRRKSSRFWQSDGGSRSSAQRAAAMRIGAPHRKSRPPTADVIKGDRNTQYESIIPEMNLTFFTKEKPNPANNEHNTCKTWHYYDTAIRDKGSHPADNSNALNALTLAREKLTTLENGAAPDRKMQCWWLYWVEHITGDLHQPLHCVSSYEFFPEKGAIPGGNLLIA